MLRQGSLTMRAPRWVRDFIGWRWAPFVALFAASLSFALLLALLVPARFEDAPHRVEASPSYARASTVDRPSAPEAPTRLVVAAAPSPTPAPEPAPPRATELAEAPSLAPPPEPASAAPVDFVANLADRADRPRAPPRASGH
jgi:hypothetical protein